MAEETDGVREAFDDALRIALTVATQLGERVARLREQFARKREARAVQTNHELEARFEAERGAMRASLMPLEKNGWWERATVNDIATARETAVAWRDYDDVARETDATIQREIRERYGIDVDNAEGDPGRVATAIRVAESERASELAKAKQVTDELTAAQLLLVAADRQDQASDLAAEPNAQSDEGEYDSATRRRTFADSLAGKVEQTTIDARLLADGENARHPREAVLTQSARFAKSSRGVSATGQRRERGIQGR